MQVLNANDRWPMTLVCDLLARCDSTHFKMHNDDTDPEDKTEDIFECEIALLHSLDDPIVSFCKYIDWIQRCCSIDFAKSKLVDVLQRATSLFVDDPRYINDPRYLKIWLLYATYSKRPAEIFVFLEKHGIAQSLSLYYEEYASLCESYGQYVSDD